MRLSLKLLSRVALSMATCLKSGLPVPRSLELSAGPADSRRLAVILARAAACCDRGSTISDALEPHRSAFPGFFLAVLQAGEMGGRLVEAFQLLHEHCERLTPTMRILRNTWLCPAVCILAGWIVRISLLLSFGLIGAAGQVAQDSLVTCGIMVAIAWTVWRVPYAKEWVDRALLQLPWVRTVLIRSGSLLFLATFKLVYETGGFSAVKTFDLALASVGNLALRRDLARAREVIEEGDGFPEAFEAPELLDDWIKGSLATGAISGKLGPSIAQIIKTEAVALESALELFNRILQRLLAYSIVLSIVGTLLFCLSSAPGR